MNKKSRLKFMTLTPPLFTSILDSFNIYYVYLQ